MVSKSFWIIRYHDSVDCFFLTVPKNMWRPSNDSKKIGHPKKLCTKEEFNEFQWIILVSQYRKTRGGTLLSFRKVLVWKNFMDKRGRVSNFSLEVFFCPKSPKNIVGEAFCVSEMF